LWISHPFGFICKIFGIKWIVFFHNSSFTHIPDRIVLPLSARFASNCLVDSNATKNFMKTIVDREYLVIPYIFENAISADSNKTNDFIWIGRNHIQKRLDLVYDFVIALSKEISAAKVTLIVSGDCYEPFNMLKKIPNWEIDIINSIPNEKVINHLFNSRFYILLSDFEGMSMSTIEAIQNGCVPITRLVGEISNYLDRNSAFVISDTSPKSLDEISKQIKDNFDNTNMLNQMNNIALKNINNLGTYCDSLNKAILQFS
jgi:glycosyltransferase involved in cell wall biosynthesis